jgi:NADH:ubiquinone oxidoreductase subunit E
MQMQEKSVKPKESLSQAVPVLAQLLHEELQDISHVATESDEKVTAARAWVRRLVNGIRERTPLVLCKGVSCSSMGAATLHHDLLQVLEGAGLTVEVQEEHCLEQCDRGPTLSIADCAFTCAREEVVDDERTWR